MSVVNSKSPAPMSKINDYSSSSARETYSSIRKQHIGRIVCYDGYVGTKYGIVVVDAEIPDNIHLEAWVRLSCIVNGREHRLFRNKAYSQLGLARITARFIREVSQS